MGDYDCSPPLPEELKVDENLKVTFAKATVSQDEVIGQGLQHNCKNHMRDAIVNLVGNTKVTPVNYDIDAIIALPSIDVLAEACRGTKEEKLEMPNGWKLLATGANVDKTNGYFGAAFMHPEHHQIVIAHKGTENCGSYVADFIGVMINKMPSQMRSALTFSEIVCSIANEIGAQLGISFQFNFTGHSLGGWLAQIAAFTMKYLGINNNKFQKAKDSLKGVHAHTVVFDSPGCKPMLLQLKDKFDVRHAGSLCSLNIHALNYE